MALDANPRVMHQINFTGNLGPVGNTQILFILEEVKETIFCTELQKYCKRVL